MSWTLNRKKKEKTTFSPSTWEAETEAGGSLEFQATPVYIESSRTARLHIKTLFQKRKTKK